MAFTDLLPVLPHLALGAGAVLVLLLSAGTRRRGLIHAAAGTALLGAFLSLFPAASHAPAAVSPLLFVDRLSILTMGLVLFAALSLWALARPYLELHDLPAGAFDVLLLLSALGGTVLAASSHAASLFLGVELLGIPLAVLSAYLPARAQGIEAGFKYLVLAGVSAAVLLFGLALLYAEAGDLSLAALLQAAPGGRSALSRLGIALVLAGLGYKLALAPFHQWAPDVYDGAPAPVAALAATVSKAAVIALLLRVAPPSLIAQDRFLAALLAAVAVASMTVGNLGAVTQRNVKRMLAYSSVSHSGYLLVAFLSPGPFAETAILLFLVATVVAGIAAFGSVTLLSLRDRDRDDLDQYEGLFWRRPAEAYILALALLSFLGLPLTAGFIAKFAIVAAGLDAARLTLVVLLSVFTAVSAAYYLRVIMAMFRRHEAYPGGEHTAGRRRSVLGISVLALQAVLLLAVGTMPQYLIEIIRSLL